MRCPCGSEAVFRQHTVKELDNALAWYGDVLEGDLPIIVNLYECVSCGRIMMRPYTPS